MDAGQAARRGLLSWAGEDMGCTASGRDLRYCMSRRVADTRLLTPRWGHPAGDTRLGDAENQLYRILADT
jgi:hypothetical protein